MTRIRLGRFLVLLLAFIAFSAGISRGQNPVELRVTAPSRMLNDNVLTLKAELFDGSGNIDWRVWSAYGTVSATRLSDQSKVPLSITYFEEHAGIPEPDSIRFYNGKGSVSITLDNGICELPGDIEISVSVLGVRGSKIVTVLDDPPLRTLSGDISGNLHWSPADGVIHLTGNVSWGSGNLVIESGTLVMINPSVDFDLSNGDGIQAVGTEEDPIYFFPTTGPPGMVLPNVCSSGSPSCEGGTRHNPEAWGQIRHTGNASSTFEYVFMAGGGNGGSEGHTRPPLLRFASSSSFVLRNSVLADNPGKAIYGTGNGSYTIDHTIITRCGHGTEFTGGTGYTLRILNTWYTGVGRGPGRDRCGNDCGFDGDLINPRSPGDILIKGCILTDGGDEAIDGSTATITVEDTILYNVRDRGYTDDGGGAQATFRNCLIFGNGGAFGGGGTKILENSTIYGGGGVSGTANVVTKSILYPQTPGCNGTMTYNILGGSSNCGSATNLTANPEFIRTSGPNYNFDLQPTSPAISAGPGGDRVGWLGFPTGEACLFDTDCDDGDECTSDKCSSGACSNDTEPGCVSCVVDGDCVREARCGGSCTVGICVYGGSCDDGLSCTSNDSCVGGFCVGADDCPEGQECNHAADACFLVPTTLIFQQGVEGYTGTEDTYIFQEFPDQSFGDEDLVEWDGQESTSPAGLGTIVALIRFENIFGTGPGQIEVAGDEINSAVIEYTTSNVGDNGEVREAYIDWDEQATWGGFGAEPGPQDGDYGPIIALAPGAPPGGGLSTSTVDVTSSIRAWADDPSQNKGWVLIPTGDDGSEFWSSEYAIDTTARPRLVVTYGGETPLPDVIRQPYLQKAAPTSMTIVWMTAQPTDSRVSFGTTPAVFDRTVLDPGSTTDHEVTLTDLVPDTTYYYEVGSTEQTHAGGCLDHYFKTPPSIGTPAHFKIWAFSDSGIHSVYQYRVRDAILDRAGSHPPDVILHAGDVDQTTPTDAHYSVHHFDVYNEVLSHTVMYPTVGNHDGYTSNSNSGSGPYFDAFALPTAGECGGVASGSEAYYSFDYANAHFVVLDSDGSNLEPDSPMMTWLEADLAATDQQWLIAYWHHPPYSKGDHDSDDGGDSGGRSVKMRETFVPVLEAGGVDLVFAGHSHLLERSVLISGAYGYGSSPNYATPSYSTLLADGKIIDSGNGRTNGNGAYVKSPFLNQYEGTVYMTLSSGGETLDLLPSAWHPVMYTTKRYLGSALIDINGNQLTLEWIRESGYMQDYFSIFKPCVDDSDCEDSRFCNGAATCSAGNCVAGATPCSGQMCDEEADICVACLEDWDCDDGLFCNGVETCSLDGVCEVGVGPCAVGETCNEEQDLCESYDCVVNADCDDENPCTDDFCNDGTCEQFDGTGPCDDGDDCTVDDFCDAGSCAGTPLDCDDGNLCTDDVCNDGLCEHTANSAACDDGDPCTQDDVCSAELCSGVPSDCSGQDDACNVGVCNPASGNCEAQPLADGLACDDGDLCTLSDACLAGVCASAPVDCSFLDDSCNVGVCNPGTGLCETQSANEGGACDDGQACTVGDLCVAGNCLGSDLDCSHLDDACQVGVCNAATGSCETQSVGEGGSCDDGESCTENDVCSSGVCAGTPVDCSGLNDACNVGVCNPATGQCETAHVNEGGTCDDGNLCTETDQCSAGICGGTTVDCSGLDDVCSIGVCSITTGNCETQPANQGGSCDDGLACTANDACIDGVCIGVEACPPGEFCDPEGVCATPVELVFRDDGVYTGTQDTFIQQSAPNASHGAEDYWEWDSQNGDPAGQNQGMIRFDGIIDGAPERIPPGARVVSAFLRLVVWDESASPPAEVRESLVDWNEATDTWNTFGGDPGVQADELGLFVADAPMAIGTFDIDVTTSVQAWADDPSSNLGWIFVPRSNNGVHVHSAEHVVVAERPALIVQVVGASCDINDECDDGIFCNGAETCDSGVCRYSSPVNCDDGFACTTDSCNETADSCEHTAVHSLCDDGNVCTNDACDLASGCVYTDNTAPCDDGDACTTVDSCNGGSCEGASPLDCNDGDVCTDDACDPASGCAYTDNTAPCDDGDVCTAVDSCNGGSCDGASPLDCNDGNVCTDDACDPVVGCVYTDNTAPCDDGDACTTVDTCNGGACDGTSPLDCNDGNVCTDDACDPASGCVYTDNTAPCDDGDVCTTVDSCNAGGCEGASPLDCNDGNVCTDDACDPATGCVYTDNTAPCDDGDACTTGDSCNAGSCEGASPLDCNDGNVCTDDACDPATGCVYTDNTAPCDDGDACTTVDTCNGGSCEGTSPLDCNDGNVCTDDACDPASGCVYTDNTSPCDDGDACTTVDSCNAGSCEGTSPLDCNDGNVCTDDACDPASGCVYTDNMAPCDDGDACTTVDTCSGGSCEGTSPLDCNDGNVCTDDACDPFVGCVYSNNVSSCDDGDDCTEGDVCSAGTCGGTPIALGEVTDVLLQEVSVLTWHDQGAGITYDVVSGLLDPMREDGGVFGAECLHGDVGEAGFTDPRPDPPAADAYYYLVRPRNECGPGSYGQTSDGVPRVPLVECL